MSNERRIDALSKIEFEGAKDITVYSKTARDLLRDLTREFEFAADEVQAVLTIAGKGHPLLFGADTKWRARRVARRLKRAAELTQGAAVEAIKFHTQFRIEFADVLSPPKTSKRTFKFDE